MISTLLLILTAALMLMFALRIGYKWGRSISEGIMKEYAMNRRFIEGMEVVEFMFPDNDVSPKKTVIKLNPKGLKEYWRNADPRLN